MPPVSLYIAANITATDYIYSSDRLRPTIFERHDVLALYRCSTILSCHPLGNQPKFYGRANTVNFVDQGADDGAKVDLAGQGGGVFWEPSAIVDDLKHGASMTVIFSR